MRWSDRVLDLVDSRTDVDLLAPSRPLIVTTTSVDGAAQPGVGTGFVHVDSTADPYTEVVTSVSRTTDDDFARTARMWSGILANKLREGEQVTAMDVPLCMIAVKLARQAHRHKRDNLVDIAGYARTAAMVAGVE